MNTFLNLAGFGMKAWDPTSLRPRSRSATARRPCRRSTATCGSCRRSSHRRASWPTSAASRARVTRSSPTRTCTPSTSPAPASCSPTTGTCGSSGACATRSSTTCARSSRRASRGRPTRSGSTRSSSRSSTIRSACRRSRELADATASALRILRDVRAAHDIDISSPVNLCVSTGRAVVATRVSFDYGWYPPDDEMLETDLPFVSLWYAVGGEYTERDGGWRMSGRRPAPVGDHRLRARSRRTSRHALEVPVLDADGRAHAGRAGLRDPRPGCLTARRSTSSPRSAPGGQEEADLVQTGPGDAPRTVRQGELLSRQGRRRRSCSSSTAASRRRSTCRATARWRSRRRPGDVVGEIGLLDRAGHAMSARVTETATLLSLAASTLRRCSRPASVGVPARAPPRVAPDGAPPQPTPPPRRLGRGRRGRPAERGRPERRSRTSRSVARPTAGTCAAWRPSTTSIPWRSGAS